MAAKTKDFFEAGTSRQFAWVLENLYEPCLRLKAESKNSNKPENIIKLDKWYQNELPKKIKSRGKDLHLTHEEMVQTIKWKLARGKFRPNLVNLIQMNTPRVVIQETKKAFRQLFKKDDVHAAAQAMCNLKGVGPAMASAVLAAGAPHKVPFMADEVLWGMPDVDSLDYTMKEFMSMVGHINGCVERLNKEGDTEWTPHKVELAVWTYYIACDMKPDLLNDIPSASSATSAASATAEEEQQPSDKEPSQHEEAVGVAVADDDEASKEAVDAEEADDKPVNGRSEDESVVPPPPNNAEVTNGQQHLTTTTNGSAESAAVTTNGTTEASSSSPSSSSSSSSEKRENGSGTTVENNGTSAENNGTSAVNGTSAKKTSSENDEVPSAAAPVAEEEAAEEPSATAPPTKVPTKRPLEGCDEDALSPDDETAAQNIKKLRRTEENSASLPSSDVEVPAESNSA